MNFYASVLISGYPDISWVDLAVYYYGYLSDLGQHVFWNTSGKHVLLSL